MSYTFVHPGRVAKKAGRAVLRSLLNVVRRTLLAAMSARDWQRARSAPPPSDRQIRILLLHANGMGGTIRTVFNLAGHLARTHDVEVVSVVRAREKPFFPIPPGVRVRYLDDRVSGRKGFLSRIPGVLVPREEAASDSFTLAAEIKLIRYIRSRREGILISTRPALNLLTALFAPPEVVTVGQEHLNLASHKKPVRRQIVRRYGKLDALVTLTETDLVAYDAALLSRPKVLTQMPNAVTALNGGISPLTGKTAITVGRLTHAKGHDLLIRTWVHVAARHPDWTMRIFGSGRKRGKLLASIEEHGLTSKVVLEGAATDVGSEMAKASMFVLSSRLEGMPMVLLEAMSKGLPVVSFNCPTGPAELITSGHDGLVVDMGDVEALADAICTVIEDQSLRGTLGAHAVKTAAGYDMEIIGKRWEDLLASLVQPR
ncbi:glycosyltransferase family 4 protein [Planotetraspora silvatica]|uniref:glycosyltransferase family 4 protein n=1 Tax=Planotetraspora silvatica TaxID=234614 RepID=UPI001EF1BCE0|nr:glycosyltransferase family 4 protein [Planotetraspora silvatica]